MIPASIPSPPAAWAGFTVGIFSVRMSALCILVAIVVATVLTSRRLTVRGAQPGVVLDFAICVIPLGLIGARLWHVATHLPDYLGAGIDPLSVLYFWDGGSGIFGGLLGGALGAWIASRWTGVRFLSFADAVAPGLLIAQGIGRIGDWFNVEQYGLPTTLPWGLVVPSSNAAFPAGLPDSTLFQPTFLYELIWDFAGAAVILLVERRISFARGRQMFLNVVFAPRANRALWGRTFALYLLWYGFGRAVIETIRIDPTMVILGTRVNAWAGLATAAVGLALLVWSTRRHPGIEPSVYRPQREWVPDTPVVSRYTAADFDDEPGADRSVTTATSAGAPTR